MPTCPGKVNTGGNRAPRKPRHGHPIRAQRLQTCTLHGRPFLRALRICHVSVKSGRFVLVDHRGYSHARATMFGITALLPIVRHANMNLHGWLALCFSIAISAPLRAESPMQGLRSRRRSGSRPRAFKTGRVSNYRLTFAAALGRMMRQQSRFTRIPRCGPFAIAVD